MFTDLGQIRNDRIKGLTKGLLAISNDNRESDKNQSLR